MSEHIIGDVPNHIGQAMMDKVSKLIEELAEERRTVIRLNSGKELQAMARMYNEACQRIEGLEISVEAAKANATCIAKALGDVTEERNALREQLGDLLDEMEEQLLK